MKKEDLRIVFMGTPEFAVETLRVLIDEGYTVVAVVTQPDKPVGRHGSVLQPSPVKQYALQHGLPVLQPVKMKDPDFIEQLRAFDANIQVVVAFRMLPEVVWAMPAYGTFNVHAALLPQYRGAAPINWAIINGETTTGVTTFFLDHNIDTGRIILQEPFNIPDDADVEYVYNGLMTLGAQLCLRTLQLIVDTDGRPTTFEQASDACLETIQCDVSTQRPLPLKTAPKIFKETCEISWMQPAKRVYDFIRGLSPVPGAWTTLVTPDGKSTVLKLYTTRQTNRAALACGTLTVEDKALFVSCADTQLEIVELQLAGKKRMSARDFLNGMKQIADCCLR